MGGGGGRGFGVLGFFKILVQPNDQSHTTSLLTSARRNSRDDSALDHIRQRRFLRGFVTCSALRTHSPAPSHTGFEHIFPAYFEVHTVRQPIP